MLTSTLGVEKPSKLLNQTTRTNTQPNRCDMGDLSKFKRSRERLMEILDHLMGRNIKDESTILFIIDIRESITLLEKKQEIFFVKDKSNS